MVFPTPGGPSRTRPDYCLTNSRVPPIAVSLALRAIQSYWNRLATSAQPSVTLPTGEPARLYGHACKQIQLIEPRSGLRAEPDPAVGVVRVSAEPRSFALVGPCEVGEECSQRLEGRSVVIAGRTSHACTQEWPT